MSGLSCFMEVGFFSKNCFVRMMPCMLSRFSL